MLGSITITICSIDQTIGEYPAADCKQPCSAAVTFMVLTKNLSMRASSSTTMMTVTVLVMIAMIMVPLSAEASLCSATVACHGIEKCNDAGVCRCPWVGLAADGHLSSSVCHTHVQLAMMMMY